MNYVRKYWNSFNDHARRDMRQTRTDVNVFRSDELRYKALKEGDWGYYYIAKNCPVWYNEMDTHYSELSSMEVKITDVPEKNEDNMVKVLIIDDHTKDGLLNETYMHVDGTCILPVEHFLTARGPDNVMETCKFCMLLIISIHLYY